MGSTVLFMSLFMAGVALPQMKTARQPQPTNSPSITPNIMGESAAVKHGFLCSTKEEYACT